MLFDYCIIGGGIIGLSTGLALLQRQPGARVILLEKESQLAVHQTGHNSGVIHSGIYYAPGSLKAKLCRVGANATKQFCIDNGIPFKACGKLLVATNTLELERLSALEERAHKNGIVCKRLDVPNLRVAEPEVQGLGALLVPEAGIVNYRLVALAMARRIRELGGEIRLGFPVASIEETAHGVTIASGKDTLTADRLIACAGLQSPPNSAPSWTYYRTRNYTFQGGILRAPPGRMVLKHLIYPLPDPALPFLGIHLTRMIDGTVTLGPMQCLGYLARATGEAAFLSETQQIS